MISEKHANLGYNSSSHNRDKTIDVIKGLGILFMVYRHARGPASEFVTLFHMAIFFIASGYLYPINGIKNIKDLKRYVIKKWKGLWIPYCIFNTLFILLHNTFLKFNIYTSDIRLLEIAHVDSNAVQITMPMTADLLLRNIISVLLFRGGTQLGGALWFFQTLFYVLITYSVASVFISQYLKMDKYFYLIQGIFAVILLFLGYACYCKDLSMKGFDKVFSVYCLIYMGNALRKYDIANRIFYVENNKKDAIRTYLVIIFSFLILFFAQKEGNIVIVNNQIVNPFFFITVSITGWFLLFGIAKLIYDQRISDTISYISKHSVYIVALHFLAFKFVNLIIVAIYRLDKYMIASFPIIPNIGDNWWIAYTCVGMVVPLLIYVISLSIKTHLINSFLSKHN